MVERGTGRALAFLVPNRTRETLVAGLVQQFLEPGTTIISNKFSPYFNLNSLGYVHTVVNHSEKFVDPFTGAHSNAIKGVESNQEKAEGNEWYTEKQTSKLPRRIQLA